MHLHYVGITKNEVIQMDIDIAIACLFVIQN
jgi:hypothetical protein